MQTENFEWIILSDQKSTTPSLDPLKASYKRLETAGENPFLSSLKKSF